MANTKTNILKLTLATDLTTLFTEWITILNNNNVIIDSEAGNFRNAIASANQQIQEIINNLLNYYTKTEIDNNFYTKDNVYAKTETYNKDEVYNTEQTYTKTEINDLIGTIARLEIKVVDTVEEVTEAGYIYLVPKESEDQKDVFDEYIFYNNKIELIGTTQIDLSNYYTKDEVDNLLKDKANAETVYNKAEVDTLLIDKANSSDVYTKNEIDSAVVSITESIPKIEVNPEEVKEVESLNTLRINDNYYRIDSVAPGKAASINYIAYLMSFHDTAIPADAKLDTLIGEIDGEDKDLIMTYNNVINNS